MSSFSCLKVIVIEQRDPSQPYLVRAPRYDRQSSAPFLESFRHDRPQVDINGGRSSRPSGVFVSSLALGVLAMQGSYVTVGVGVDPKQGVLIKEYWRGEHPFYAIANVRKEPFKIAI